MRAFNSQRFLSIYAGVLTGVVTWALLSGFTETARAPKFDTITVQRINVVEPDGTLRMVLTNNNRVPSIIMRGREFSDFTGRKGSTTAGILFYDGEGSESGGLTFGGRKDEQGRISRFGHLSFDRYDQDQMFTIDARDEGGTHYSSIQMIDQPAWSITELLELLESIKDLPAEEQQARINEFLATHPQGAVRTIVRNSSSTDTPQANENIYQMNDPAGSPRLKLGLDGSGTPRQDFLDSTGNVIYTIPPAAK
jgi:hypothetical protein